MLVLLLTEYVQVAPAQVMANVHQIFTVMEATVSAKKSTAQFVQETTSASAKIAHTTTSVHQA